MSVMLKKKSIITLNIILGVILAVAASFLIFGTKQIILADKMPPVDISRFNKQVALSLIIQFFILLIPITAIALPQTIILGKKGILSVKKDIIAVLLF